MRSRFVDADTPTHEARLEAQRLAFGPMLFQAARVLRDSGALEHLNRQGKRGATAEELSESVDGLSLYAARVLLEAGLAARVLALVEERFCITKLGYLLLRDPMTRVNFDFVQDVCYHGMSSLGESLQQGRPAGLATLGPWDTIYAGLSELPEPARQSWFAFDHFYSDGAFDAALPFVLDESPENIVDIGGNTGKFAIACCARAPDVHVTLLDYPGQLARARENMREHGLTERVSTQEVDLLDPACPIPEGHDVYWMSQLLDCFSEPQIVDLVRRTAHAMTEGSRLFVLETFWDRQRHEAGRLSVISTSLYFAALANGNSKMYHSERMRACIEEAGLKVTADHDAIGLSHTLLRCQLP